MGGSAGTGRRRDHSAAGACAGAAFDLAERLDDGVEGQQGRGVAGLVVAHRLQHRDVRPAARPAAAPFSFSIARISSRTARSSSGVEPTTWRAMIEEEAWPSAQALTSWAKSRHRRRRHGEVDVTVEPHSFECAVALASGRGEPAEAGDVGGEFEDAPVVDVVEHAAAVTNMALTNPYIGSVGRTANSDGRLRRAKSRCEPGASVAMVRMQRRTRCSYERRPHMEPVVKS